MRVRLLSNPWAALCLIGVLYQGAQAGHKQIYQAHEGFAKGITDNRMQQSGFTGQKGNSFHDKYAENPSESKYGEAPEKMTSNAASAIDKSAYAKATRDGFNENPPFKINPNDPVYAESKFYMQNAKSVSHGTSDRYVDCQAKKKCRTAMVQHTCEKSQTASLTCHKVATPHTKKTPYIISITHQGNLIRTTNRHANIITPEEGIVTQLAVYIYLSGSRGGGFLCGSPYNAYLNGAHYAYYKYDPCGRWYNRVSFNKSGLNVVVGQEKKMDFSIAGYLRSPSFESGSYKLTMQVTRYKDESYITWSDVIC